MTCDKKDCRWYGRKLKCCEFCNRNKASQKIERLTTDNYSTEPTTEEKDAWKLGEIVSAEIESIKVKVHLDMASHADEKIREYKFYDIWVTVKFSKNGEPVYDTRTTCGLYQRGFEEAVTDLAKELAVDKVKEMLKGESHVGERR